MASNELLIKISADAKNAVKAFDEVKSKTADLQDSLNKASLIGAAAFAALSAEVFLSVSAFSEAEASSNALSQALQNQGIFTNELRQQYDQYADAVSAKTGIDDDQITKAQAIAQGYLGQTKITEDLTQAIADLSVKYGSTEAAATAIGKAIGTSTNALAKEGITFREGATEAEKYAAVLEQVTIRYGGQAEAANKASFGVNGLKVAFGNLQEGIGARFAPVVEIAANALKRVIEFANDNPIILDLAAAFIAAGIAVGGLVAIAAPLFAAFTGISAAAAAMGVGLGALLGPIGLIGLAVAGLVAGAVLLALNWDKTMNVLRAATTGAVTFITEQFQGLRQVLQGTFELDAGKVAAGLDRITGATRAAVEATVAAYREGNIKIEAEQLASQEKQNAQKKALAEKQQSEEDALAARKAETLAAQEDLKLLQLEQSSKALIDLKQQEVAILKNLEEEKNRDVIDASNARLEQIRAQQDQQQELDLQRTREFDEQKKALMAELEAEGVDTNAETNPLLDAQLEQLRASKLTEQEIDNQAAVKRLQDKIKNDNEYLLNQKKFGTAYATIYKAMHSEIYEGSKSAFGELAALQSSSNSTLKSIGKAAAVANIIIKTAESAMNIYAGFSTIPIIGPALGVAGAAAAIAFGAEQVGRVTAAAGGALVGDGGQMASGDRRPFMLEDGELVSPRRNFNEVVSGVQTERSGIIDEVRTGLSNLQADQGARNLTVVVQGDVLADDAYMQRFVEKLSDTLEFGNAKLFGVTA